MTSAPADAPAAPAPQQPSWILFAPVLVVMVFMLFTSRNQRKREAETRASLKKGDRVVSQSGLIGELLDIEGAIAKVKLAPGTNVQMLVSSVSPYVAATGAAAEKGADKTLKDLKDAKATEGKKG